MTPSTLPVRRHETGPADTPGPLGVGPQLAYIPALDGIRALAVLAVMANHAGLGWASGGLLGVNAFFVLSGFLITQLLLTEWAHRGTIRLRAFWARRARRLLPALFLLVAAIALYAVLFAPSGTQPSLWGDGLSTLFYVNNWHQILDGRSYFVQVSALSPLLHTWSLAIEEQFYLVWPLVVLGVLKLWRKPGVLLVVAVVGAAASALEMAVLFHTGPDVDPTRLYFGTDTRAQDVLIGAAAGILLSGRVPPVSTRARAALSWTTAVAVAVLVWDWTRVNGISSFTYRGGFGLADLMVAVVVCGVTLAPTGLPSRVLSVRPLRWVGAISYGLYLWHWPVFLVLNQARTGLENWALFAVRSVVTFAVATLSFYLVETAIRQRRFGSWRSWAWLPGMAVGAVALLAVTTVGAEGALHQGTTQVQRNAYLVNAFPDDHRSKVMFVGDSLSLYVGYGLAPYAARYGITIGGRSISGCGLATAVPENLHGTPTYPLAPCGNWPSLWRSDVSQLRPDVAVVVVGWWEAMDRWYLGRWQHLGDPQYDAYERANFERAVQILSAGGARVVLVTAPYFDTGEQLNGQPWDEDDPARVDVLNRIIESVAAGHPGVVSVVPLNRYLDPNGHFTWTIGGKVVRLGDGVHTTPAAGTYLAPKILPLLAAAGRR